MAVFANISYWALLFIPSFFWGAYHYYKDRHKPEPIPMLILALLLGYGSAYIGLILYGVLGAFGVEHNPYVMAQEDPLGLFFYTILVIGPVEEFAKFLPFILILTRMRHFDEEIDGIIYAAFIALGFAFHENRYYLDVLTGGQAVARSLVTPIVHALFASVWGYAYGFHTHLRMSRFTATLLGLLLSMFLHGVYDFYAFGVSMYGGLCPPLIILMIWIWRMRRIRDHNRSLARKKP